MRLERNLISGAPPSLANQIPVASGVCSSGERKRAIDLAEMCGPSEYTFFELKVQRAHPAFRCNGVAGIWRVLRRRAL